MGDEGVRMVRSKHAPAAVDARFIQRARVIEARMAADREHTIPAGDGTGPSRDRRDDGGEFQNVMRVTRSAWYVRKNRTPLRLARS